MNRGKRIVILAQKLGCFVESASRLYSLAEKEHKVRELVNKYDLDRK